MKIRKGSILPLHPIRVSSKRFHQILLLAAALLTLYFSCRFGASCVEYFSLCSSVKGKIERWEIEERKDTYRLKADYSFEAEGKIWRGSFSFNTEYLNEYAALADLKEKAKQPQTVWYRPKKPDRSALEKSFPFNLLLRSLSCCAVFIYFFYLNRKIQSLDLLD